MRCTTINNTSTFRPQMHFAGPSESRLKMLLHLQMYFTSGSGEVQMETRERHKRHNTLTNTPLHLRKKNYEACARYSARVVRTDVILFMYIFVVVGLVWAICVIATRVQLMPGRFAPLSSDDDVVLGSGLVFLYATTRMYTTCPSPSPVCAIYGNAKCSH